MLALSGGRFVEPVVLIHLDQDLGTEGPNVDLEGRHLDDRWLLIEDALRSHDDGGVAEAGLAALRLT